MISVPESCPSRTYCCEGNKLLWSPASLWMPCTLHSIIQFSGNSWQDSKQEVGKIFEGIQFRARNCIRGYTEPETASGGYTEPETASGGYTDARDDTWTWWHYHQTCVETDWCEGRNNLMWAAFFFLPLQSLQSRISIPYGLIPSSDNSW